MKTYSPRSYSATPGDIVRGWYVIDAEDVVLGRLASHVANRLRGKHKPTYTPHMDCGDNIVVVNARKVKLTGTKRDRKIHYWHTGYPGGLKRRTYGAMLDGKHPERVVRGAVERMVPRGPLGRAQMRKLHVYAGPDHPHEAQRPETIDFASLNPKNKRSA